MLVNLVMTVLVLMLISGAVSVIGICLGLFRSESHFRWAKWTGSVAVISAVVLVSLQLLYHGRR